jgi:general secretion pathway protein G
MIPQVGRSKERSFQALISRRRAFGWTLLELMAVVTIAGVLSTVAYGSYASAIERAKITQATVDIAKIHGGLERYRIDHQDELPMSLAEIGLDFQDPWGKPYQYLSFDSLPENAIGPVRKDHNLVPINSRYDLYSMGPDGESRAPLTANASRDDIILANDGSYIGPAADY